MSAWDLKIGDLIFTKSLASYVPEEGGRVTGTHATFKTRDGRMFAMMLLGIVDPKTFTVEKAKERLGSLGWKEIRAAKKKRKPSKKK